MMDFIFKIVFRILMIPFDNALRNHNLHTNQELGYVEVAEKVAKRATYAKGLLIHIAIFIGMVMLSANMGSLEFSGILWMWFLVILFPHVIYIMYYFIRWKPEILETLPKPDDKEKAKRIP